MADLSLNFSSQWPTIQVAKVIYEPQTFGETDPNYSRKHKHGLPFPPLAIGMGFANGSESYSPMLPLDVDNEYVYMPTIIPSRDTLECAVIYAVDISSNFDYRNYSSITSDPLPDTSRGSMDMRKFLLHSRSVGPMLMSVATKNFSPGDVTLTYISNLEYPSFVFGYVLWSGIWMAAHQQGQAYPVTNTDGHVSTVFANNPALQTRGSIVAIRNPAIITHNTVTANL